MTLTLRILNQMHARIYYIETFKETSAVTLKLKHIFMILLLLFEGNKTFDNIL